MKTFTLNRGYVSEGIKTVLDSKLGTIVLLQLRPMKGAPKTKKVGLFHKNPPEIVNDSLFFAHPVKIALERTENNGAGEEVIKTTEILTLAKPNTMEDDRAMLKIATPVQKFEKVRGKIVEETGLFSNPPWGRVIEDAIVTIFVNTVVRFRYKGRYEVEDYALIYDGTAISILPWTKYEEIDSKRRMSSPKSESKNLDEYVSSRDRDEIPSNVRLDDSAEDKMRGLFGFPRKKVVVKPKTVMS